MTTEELDYLQTHGSLEGFRPEAAVLGADGLWCLPVAPAQDCPACPDCSAPCGSLCLNDEREAPPAGVLRCVCCGHEWVASEAELEQARAADAAWMAVQEREREEADRDA